MASNTPTRGAERGGKTPGCSGAGGMTFFAAGVTMRGCVGEVAAWGRGRGSQGRGRGRVRVERFLPLFKRGSRGE